MYVYSNICTHPINMLFEILSKCPLYLSHGPAALFYTKVRLIEILWPTQFVASYHRQV